MDPKTPVTETFAEMKALVFEGKVKYVGISEAGPDDIRAAHAVCPLTAVQLEWSLWSRWGGGGVNMAGLQGSAAVDFALTCQCCQRFDWNSMSCCYWAAVK